MTIEEIISGHRRLEQELFRALATMERKDTIQQIRQELIKLQDECPHFSDKYNFVWVNDKCPYCGKKVR